MATVFYSPGDSRGWGVGNSSMRDYYLIGGALQPSDIYTVRVREHWRRKRGTRAKPAAAIVLPTAPASRGRSRKRAIAIPGRVLRSRTIPALPALPAPPALVPAGPVVPAGPPIVVSTGAKRRRIA